MRVKVKNMKPGLCIFDMAGEIQTIVKTSEQPADQWWGETYEIKVSTMNKPFETYGEMEFECYWPKTS